jgi:septal ring factor EnvC (AmiA/AmiB activator)
MKNETKQNVKAFFIGVGVAIVGFIAILFRRDSERSRIRKIDNTIGKLKKGIDSSTRQLDKVKTTISGATETSGKLGTNIDDAIKSTNNALRLLEDLKKRNDD